MTAAEAPPERFGLAVLVRAPRAVWALTLLNLSGLLVWSILTPVYDAADEPYHVDMVLAAAERWDWPPPWGRRLEPEIIESLYALGFSVPGSDNPFLRTPEPVIAVDAVPRADRPTWEDLRSRVPDGPTERFNQMAQHPPLYYKLGALLFVVAPWESWPFDLVVWVLRLFSVLLVAPLPLFAHAAARRLTGSVPIAVSAAVVPLGIPQLSHIGGAVNNDNLLTSLAGLLTVVLVYVARGDAGLRTAVWAGIVAMLGLLTKGFALALPVWVAAAYALALVRGSGRRGEVLRAAVVALALTGVGVLWWVRNLVVYGAVQPSVVVGPDPPASFTPDLELLATTFYQSIIHRFWGAFGWDEIKVEYDTAAWAAGVVATGAALAVAWPWPGRRVRRTDLLLLLLPTVLIAGILFYGVWSWYVATSRYAAMQGRYLQPAVTGIAVVAAAGYGRLLGRFARVLPLLLAAGAGYMQWLGSVTVLEHFYGVPEPLEWTRASIAAALAWSPLPRAVGLGFCALGGAAALWSLAELGLLAVRGPRSPEPPDQPDAEAPAPVSLEVRAAAPSGDGPATGDAL